MSFKSSLPWRPVLSPFSTGTEKSRLAMLFPGVATGLMESQPWRGSPRWPPPTLARLVSRQPSPDLLHPCLALEPWIFRYTPAHQRLRLWMQLPTMLKGQGPPATLSICQARPPESRIRKERGANSRKPQLWAQSPTQKMKRWTFMWAVVTLKKHELFQVKLCLVSPWAVDSGVIGRGA